MKRIFGFLAGALMVSASGWAATGTATVVATSTSSTVNGKLQFEETNKGLHVWGAIAGAPTGDHGFHIHEFGGCAEKGKAAGDHYNPDGHQHGQVLKDGMSKAHAGDLGNVSVGADGSATIDLLLPKLTLTGGKYPVAGRAVILHEKKDDFGQPLGNAGGRIGCGPILITGK